MGSSSFLRCAALFVLTLAHSHNACASAARSEVNGLHLVAGVVSIGAMSDGSPIPTRTFYANEDIQFYTKVSWNPAQKSGGTHQLLYKWYTGDRVALSFGASREFQVNPTYWWAFTHAAHLGPGHHKVELYLDDSLFASDEFDLLAGTRPNEPAEDTVIKETGRALLLKGDTRAFDVLATQYRDSGERTASGTWKLALLYSAIDRRLYSARDPNWDRLQDTSDAWLASQPHSISALIVNARLLSARAWAWRGDGMADQVNGANWRPYREFLERARSVLDQHAEVARQDGEWDALRISIARQQGASSQSVLAMAREALNRNPFYYPIHNAAVNALLPKWGGSAELIEDYVSTALERSRMHEGTQAYARIYYYVTRSTASSALDDLNLMGAKWPPMKQSLSELLRAYPSSFNQDLARAITCFSGDAPAFRMLGRGSTGDIVSVAWWDTRDWRQGCNQWAFEGKHIRGSPLDRARVYLSFLRGFGAAFWTRLRLVALVTFILVESVLALLATRSRNSVTVSAMAGANRAFNPLDYPRTYRVSPTSSAFLTRLAVWMALLGSAVAYLLTTVPWPDPAETEGVMVLCITASTTGMLLILNRLMSRLVLTMDSLALTRLIRTRMLHRDEILGVRQDVSPSGLRWVEVVPRQSDSKPFRVPLVSGQDDAFRLWFDSLPASSEPQISEQVHA